MKKFTDRYVALAAVFIIVFAVILGQLVNLQILHGEAYDAESQRKLLNERKVTAPRGNIYDRNGAGIAVNRQGFVVQMVFVRMQEEDRNRMFLNLLNIFEKNGDSYYRSLSRYLTFRPFEFGTALGKSGEEITKWINTTVADKAKDAETIKTAEEAFQYLRGKYRISGRYNDEEAYKIMTLRYEIQIRGYDALNPICLARDVSRETVAEIEERHADFPGVTTELEPVRKYIDANLAAHIIGYVRNISAEDYKRLKGEGYSMNDIIGQEGIERQAEKELKGQDGLRTLEVDTRGRTTEELDNHPPVPGKNVVLTLDMKLQKAAMDSLERNIDAIRKNGGKNNFGDASAGAVVALDVNSGEVLAMASYPSYDPSVYLAGSDNKEAQKLILEWNDPKNEFKPLFNRAISGIYTPGSTFKPLIGISGLQEGVITPDTYIYDEGVTNIGGWTFTCLEYKNGYGAHGALTLERALATSCNIYFHKLGTMVGIDNIGRWAKYFGLGEPQGIDIPGERKGILASKQYKLDIFKDDWRPADTAQASIGQLYNAFTPLQLANYVSTIANGGKLFKPHLIKRIVSSDGFVVKETAPEYTEVPLSQENLNAVKKGMIAVANSVDGTAATLFDGLPFKVAGKTGTAETGAEATHSSNALFVCYAPADTPKIAVAVVVERGAWGAYTAPIARDILAEYFSLYKQNNSDDRVQAEEVIFTR